IFRASIARLARQRNRSYRDVRAPGAALIANAGAIGCARHAGYATVGAALWRAGAVVLFLVPIAYLVA
ncbi:MAG TPA: hypothetical protein VHB98_09290, partial [Chloroflexota bacterium]|nr:hypothetical protein [Chloroflexota bacterium]